MHIENWQVRIFIRKVIYMAIFQHYLNSLHVFCLLRKLGMKKEISLYLARQWERYVHPLVYNRYYRKNAVHM